MESVKELASRFVLADLAGGGSIGVEQVDTLTSASHVVRQVIRAGAVGRVEESVLIFIADDLGTPDTEGQHAVDDVVEGVEVVHPETPEHVELIVWNQDTTEDDEGTDDQRVHKRSEGCVRRVGGDELTNTGVNELVDQHHEEGGTRSVGVMGKSPNGVVPTGEVENGTDAEVWELGNNQSSDEGNPGVHLGLLLASIVNITTLDEERLKLVDDTGGDENEVPDGEHLQIQSDDTWARTPEGETIESGGDDVKLELVVDVVGVSEKRDIHPLGDDLDLVPKRHREIITIIDCSGGLGSSVLNHSVQFRDHLALLRGVEPDLMPVLVLDSLDTTSNNVNHEFSWVGLGRTDGTVLAKVFLDAARIFTDVSKVDSLSTPCEEKESIELSEKLRGRLVNCYLEHDLLAI